MGTRSGERLLFACVGFAAALLAFWAAGLGRDPGPSEREERIARHLRIAREVERDLTRLRLEEVRERRARERRARERKTRTHTSRLPAPVTYETMRPKNRAEMVGRYIDDETGTIWLELLESGRYVYEGIPGEFLEGTKPPATAHRVRKNGRWVGVPNRPASRNRPGYAQAHTGTWTFEDGVLEMEPFDPLVNAYASFSWDAGEAAVRLHLLGVAPSHINTVLLRHIVEPE